MTLGNNVPYGGPTRGHDFRLVPTPDKTIDGSTGPRIGGWQRGAVLSILRAASVVAFVARQGPPAASAQLIGCDGGLRSHATLG